MTLRPHPFKTLPDACFGVARRLKARDVLFRHGDPARAVYLVVEGRLILRRRLTNGDDITVHVARAGESFAEAALFADLYQCDAVAETASMAIPLPKTPLKAALANDSQLALDLLTIAFRHVQDLRTRLEIRNIRRADERIMAWLELKAAGSPPTLDFNGRTWKDMAAELGLAPEALYRTLVDLERSGAIVRAHDGVILRRQPSNA